MTDDIDGPRACRKDELSELLELVNYVFRVIHGRPPSIESDYPQIYNPDNLEYVRVIKAEGRIRASVGMYPSAIAAGDITLNSAGINCTTTHPDWRRKGFGGLLMRDAYSVADAQGADFVHLSPGVPEWYRKYDLEYGGCSFTYLLDRGNVDVLPQLSGAVIDSGFETYIEQVQAIHLSERVGNIRSLEQTLVVLPRVKAELFVAQVKGAVKAYVYIRNDNNQCIEHGGPAEMVAALLRQVFHIRDEANAGLPTSKRDEQKNVAILNPKISLLTNPLHRKVVNLFDGLGVPVERTPWHMIYLTNPARLLRKLGLGDIRVTESEGKFVLERGRKKETFNRRQLTKLIFGPERISDLAPDRLPIPIFTPRTDHV